MRRSIAFFLPAAVVATLGCGLVYAVVQGGLRSGANDPQIQLAGDAARALDAGVSPATVAGSDSIDIANSLAPFVAIDDANGQTLASGATLEGQPPAPPPGVLVSAHSSGLDLVTWQPREGVRIALVAVPWTDGTVLAGRSLRLVEQREDDLLMVTALGWLAMLLASAVAAIIAAWLWPRGSAPGSLIG